VQFTCCQFLIHNDEVTFQKWLPQAENKRIGSIISKTWNGSAIYCRANISVAVTWWWICQEAVSG